MVKEVREIKIIIPVEFGSGFQEEIHLESLQLMIAVWCNFIKRKHKENEVGTPQIICTPNKYDRM